MDIKNESTVKCSLQGAESKPKKTLFSQPFVTKKIVIKLSFFYVTKLYDLSIKDVISSKLSVSFKTIDIQSTLLM